VDSGEAAMAVYRRAMEQRQTAETKMNLFSSRSHVVVLTTVARQDHTTHVTRFSQLYVYSSPLHNLESLFVVLYNAAVSNSYVSLSLFSGQRVHYEP
jgi:hypothetical protein